jgi:hypothetical protein
MQLVTLVGETEMEEINYKFAPITSCEVGRSPF